MTRDVGGIEVVRETFPVWAIDLLGEVTVLGDPLVLCFVFLVLYWLLDRETGIALLVVFAGGVVLLTGLKTALAVPRPPASGQFPAVDGYGFPSGHAFNATVAFGTLARLRPDVSGVWRYAFASIGVIVIALSRVAIGVHYTVDVLAGIAIGVLYLFTAWRVVWPRRKRLVILLDALYASMG